MRVYHGSTMVVEHPLVHVGRKGLDFGLGFYVTDIRQQAVAWADRMARVCLARMCLKEPLGPNQLLEIVSGK